MHNSRQKCAIRHKSTRFNTKMSRLKLGVYEVQYIALKRLNSFLYNRLQYVTYNNIKPDRGKVKCGVPQWSILGPLVFNYTIMICPQCRPPACQSFSLMIRTYLLSDKNLQSVPSTLNEQVTAIFEWQTLNKHAQAHNTILHHEIRN